MRTAVHYAAALLLLTVYGGQVCPLIDTLTLSRWGSILAVVFGLMLLLRAVLLPRLVSNAPLYDQPGRQFMLEFFLCVGSGVLLSAYNSAQLGFSLAESGSKVVLGFTTFGFFIGLDLALARERVSGEAILRRNLSPPESRRYTSLTRKFSGFALATVFLVGTVLILTVVKDVYWLAGIDFAKDGMKAQLLILLEVGFILLVLCGYILNIIVSYTRNIRFFFGNETTVLRKVRDGDLSSRVSPLTRDEFAEIADHTNTMIDGLRERDRVKSVLGKAVSPTIARRLIEQEEQGISLGGSMQPLVILFCDIRDFTAHTEASPPELVIKDLNAWFSEAVTAIQARGGIVDKFIGDGILAVFGLDGDAAACRNAVDCAADMQARLDSLNPHLCAPMRVGIGIHKGDVLAGIIGSPERLEFTVIGDAVNTASRVEGLTRSLGASVLITEAVMADLGEEGDGWQDYGHQSLKGKSETVRLYGRPLPGVASA